MSDVQISLSASRLRRGVTLLEMLLVLVLLGLMMGVAIPKMAGAGHVTKLRGAARDVAGLLRHARATAVFGEIEVDVRFSPEEGLYTLNYDPVEVELVVRDRRGSRSRSSRDGGIDRRTEDLIRRQAAKWLRVRSLPTDRRGDLEVMFDTVETEMEVESTRDRHTALPAIKFYPDGTASAGRIILRSRAGLLMSVDVLTATGAVTVTEGDIREEETRS
jgi:prepilin-type N-terminal cleavage/methylation domain-containing protein